MADVFTKKKRSEIMARIRSKDTAIERFVFKELRKRGLYFKKHYKRIKGCPDIALPRAKKAVFIDGDFWHGWQFAQRKAPCQNTGRTRSIITLKETVKTGLFSDGRAGRFLGYGNMKSKNTRPKLSKKLAHF